MWVFELETMLKMKDLEGAKYLIDNNKNNIDSVSSIGETALMVATRLGNLDIVKYLVNNRADIDKQRNVGNTKTNEELTKNGTVKRTATLTKQEEDFNLVDKVDDPLYVNATTALMMAIQRGDTDIAKYLVDKGANVNIKGGKYGDTPLMRASLNLYGKAGFELTKSLVEHGAKVNEKDKSGYTALMYAALNKNIGVMKYLVENGAVIDEKNNYGWTALMIAATNEYYGKVKYLVEHGARLDIENEDGDTALTIAIKKGYIIMADYLEQQELHTDTQNDDRRVVRTIENRESALHEIEEAEQEIQELSLEKEDATKIQESLKKVKEQVNQAENGKKSKKEVVKSIKDILDGTLKKMKNMDKSLRGKIKDIFYALLKKIQKLWSVIIGKGNVKQEKEGTQGRTKVDQEIEGDIYYYVRDRAVEEGRKKNNHIQKEKTQSRTKVDEEKKTDRVNKK